MRRRSFTLPTLLFSLLLAFGLQAQVTTASLTGAVTDEQGQPLIGATVVAIHLPSGSQYGTTTREDGGYDLPNLRIGGPYEVTASYVGHKSFSYTGVSLKLAQKLELNFKLPAESVQLETAVVTAEVDPILNNERTGASTNIDEETLRNLPTISRSAQDYYRLTPSSDGNSFGGRNDKMNNFTLDGSIFNNPFGLDAATPGSQTSAQPVSLDAIEQIQVNIAPYDVTQAGFTGAAINAVTKSGTNTFQGTVFAFYRNQDLTGSKVRGEEIFVPDLTHMQAGFSLGGPIVKDKLFFFANAEIERRSDLGSNFLAARPGLTGERVSRVTAEDLELVSQVLFDNFGYETGPYENYQHRTDNQKGIIKLDWNINKNHTLTATYNFLDATKDKPAHPEAIGRRGPDAITLQFYNSGYAIRNLLHSGIVELKSIFGNKMSNNLQVGYTAFRDSRDPFSEPFPVININKDGVRYIVAGHEPFSIHNRLNQNVSQLTDNFNIYMGAHTFTIGTSFEKFEFDNSFNLGVYDPFGFVGGTFGPGFESVQAFVDSVNSGYVGAAVDYARSVYEQNGGDEGELGKGWALAETNVGQWAFYVQDEWDVSDKLTVTAGLRIDKPLYFDTKQKIQENIDRQCCYDPSVPYFNPETGDTVFFDHTVLPSGKPLFSPRFGFNYDIKGDNSSRLRGGSGLFSGRFPFVWLGNQVANPNFFFYCITHPDFRWPQVWRSNLGWDQKFGGNWTFSADAVYSKDIYAMMVRNYGIKPPSGQLQGVDNRAIYTANDRNSVYGNDAYVFTNTNVGYTFNVSLQLQRKWSNGLFTSIAYSYLDAKDASSIPAEISSDAFARNPALGNVNVPVLAASRYGNKHRVVGSAYKTFEYANGKMSTSVALYMEYTRGGRFSYTYSGDINGDGSGLNDLIYIPSDSEIDQMTFSGSAQEQEDQRRALKEFIAQDEYLSAHRGEYAGKYAILSPWYSTWDMRVLQNFKLASTNLQLSMDILNLGNLLNSNWGVRQLPTNTQPIGVSVDGSGNPTYSFDTAQKSTFTDDFSLLSRWQIQFGIRLSF